MAHFRCPICVQPDPKIRIRIPPRLQTGKERSFVHTGAVKRQVARPADGDGNAAPGEVGPRSSERRLDSEGSSGVKTADQHEEDEKEEDNVDQRDDCLGPRGLRRAAKAHLLTLQPHNPKPLDTRERSPVHNRYERLNVGA